MIPGIDPKVDYVFKKLFGTEASVPLLLSLLDAVLKPPPDRRLVTLEIIDPFNSKETPDDKLSIVDVKARDQSGRLYNIEMQMQGLPAHRLSRIGRPNPSSTEGKTVKAQALRRASSVS